MIDQKIFVILYVEVLGKSERANMIIDLILTDIKKIQYSNLDAIQ